MSTAGSYVTLADLIGGSTETVMPHWHDGPLEFVNGGEAGCGWLPRERFACYLPCCENGHVWTAPVRVGLLRRRTIQRCAYRHFYPLIREFGGQCHAERAA